MEVLFETILPLLSSLTLEDRSTRMYLVCSGMATSQ